ncbi:insulin receptor-like isoform X2 [Phlebotomus papatasi]|uniref:insulin receptor-like isoform X2 n=1 Tax=Phlebotomus papatasi TaxID=29031 RepID=UPI0024843E51|nr:insulin receptor-like isoform X2 [Phlebotomus papatasi]
MHSTGDHKFFLIFVIFCGSALGAVAAKECFNIDIRNHVSQFEKLRNCSVVIGYLNIVLLEKTTETHFQNLTFPELREITGMLVVFRVFGLKTFKTLFPNLTVIRGQFLLANYALVIYEMPHLENVGLRSLLSIQRGYVRIEKCRNLCYTDTIDWNKITGTLDGGNYIQKQTSSKCPTEKICVGCKDALCWNTENCQRFEGPDSFFPHYYANCDSKCLGGCRNGTCYTCRGITDEGYCVDSCEQPKLLNTLSVRCVNKTSCRNDGRIIHDDKCLSECPIGFTNSTDKCELCKGNCPKTCYGTQIDFIENAEKLRGCTTINGSLQIKLNTDMAKLSDELEENLGAIREIDGYLKIYRSSSITSLKFLKSLHVIHGYVLENEQFALVVYENSNLQQLFEFDGERSELRIERGGMMFHYNQKLCSTEIRKLQLNTDYNRTLDYISKESNGYKHSCDMETIRIDYTVLSPTNVTIYWEKYHVDDKNILEGYLIYYIEAPRRDITTYFGRDSCSRHSWRSELIDVDSLIYDDQKRMYAYNLTDLKSSTQYAFYVRTYLSSEGINAQSTITYIRMPIDKLFPPVVKTKEKSSDFVILEWAVESVQKSKIAHFYIDVYRRSYSKDIIDKRNYCQNPRTDETEENEPASLHCCSDHDEETFEIIRLHTSYEKDLDCELNPFQPGCQLFEYDRFKRELQLLVTHCHLYHGRDSPICRNPNARWAGKWDGTTGDSSNTRYRVAANTFTFKIPNLSPYTLYTFHVFACTAEFDCSTYYSHNERTAIDSQADLTRNTSIIVDPDISKNTSISHNPDNADKIVAIRFHEPIEPNGLTVAYKVEIRKIINNEGDPGCEIVCITRREHELNDNIFRYQTFEMTPGTYSFRVQAISLAMDGPWSDQLLYPVLERIPVTNSSMIIVIVVVVLFIVSCGFFVWYKYVRKVENMDDTVVLMSDLEPPQAEEDSLLEMHKIIRERQREAEKSRTTEAGGDVYEAGPSRLSEPAATEKAIICKFRLDEEDSSDDGDKALVIFE